MVSRISAIASSASAGSTARSYCPPISSLTTVCFVAALVAAVLDWVGVGRGNNALEYVAKPATTALLIAAAVALDPATDVTRWWTVGALAFCLAGDVFLMLPNDLFVPGLASFLVAHVLFGLGFVAHEQSRAPILTGAVALLALVVILPPILRAVRNREPELRIPVAIYGVTIVAMLGASGTTGAPLAVAGAAVFVVSDTILACNRFVRPLAHGHLAVMVTYHAALALLVASLI